MTIAESTADDSVVRPLFLKVSSFFTSVIQRSHQIQPRRHETICSLVFAGSL